MKIASSLSEVSCNIPLKLFQLVHNTPFKLTRFELGKGVSTPIDSHIEKEYWIIMNGLGKLSINENIVLAKSGDIFFFDSYTAHRIESITEDTLIIYSIYWS